MVEREGQQQSNQVRDLGRGPDCEVAGSRLILGDHTTRFDCIGDEPLIDQPLLNDAVGLTKGPVHVPTRNGPSKGDIVLDFVMYQGCAASDGLFEVEDSSGALFTEERLHLSAGRYATLPPKEFFSALLTEVRNFTQRETFDDDVCIVGLEVRQMTDAKVEKSHCRDK